MHFDQADNSNASLRVRGDRTSRFGFNFSFSCDYLFNRNEVNMHRHMKSKLASVSLAIAYVQTGMPNAGAVMRL